jgi:glucosamine-6-phosphate deaminase
MSKYFGEKFHPEYGITQGIHQIMAAKKVILLANGPQKAEIIHTALEGNVGTHCPASILQRHPDCTVVLDEEAAAKLQKR